MASNRVTAGGMDRRITILRPVTTRNSYGETITTWQTFAERWARHTPISGQESFEVDERSARQIVEFTLYHLAGVTPSMRVRYQGRDYQIESVMGPDRRRTIVLRTYALEVTSSSGGGTAGGDIVFTLEHPTDDAGTWGLTWASPLVQHPNVFPKVHVWLTSPAQAGYVAPGYPTPGNTLAEVAESVANWVEYNIGKQKAAGRTDHRYALYLHGVGEHADDTVNPTRGIAVPLFSNVGDELLNMDPGPTPDVAGKSRRYRHRGIFCAAGRAGARAQCEDLIELIDEKLRDRGLPTPTWVTWDLEQYPDIGKALPTNDSTCWWGPSQLDGRWATEPVWKGRTMASLLASATNLDGTPLVYNPLQSVNHASNKDFLYWLDMTAWRVINEAHREVLQDPILAVWPNAIVGNYDIFALSPDSDPVYYMESPTLPVRIARPTELKSQGPTCYPVRGWLTAASSPKRISDWLGLFSMTTSGDPDTDLRAIGVEHAKRRLSSCAAGSSAPLWPWFGPTGWVPEVLTTENGVGVDSPALTLDDQKAMWDHAYAKGARLGQLWWGGVLTSQEATDWLALVNHAVSSAA